MKSITGKSRCKSMDIRLFEDEMGNYWKVTKFASSMNVEGPFKEGERLHDIARSCAFKLGINATKSGTPLEYVNEHRRIWNLIWQQGQVVEH
jgi:hypothetical protein